MAEAMSARTQKLVATLFIAFVTVGPIFVLR